MKDKVLKGLFWETIRERRSSGDSVCDCDSPGPPFDPGGVRPGWGIIMIFITIANVVVQYGFSTALVQRPRCDEKDFSSVCYFSLLIALVMYGLLYLAAPWDWGVFTEMRF